MAKTTHTWADGPWPLIETPSATKDVNSHPALYIANEMAFAHNAMLRGFNSIYLQAPHVHAPTDVTDFLFFTASWTDWMVHHHGLEEEMMFPLFEEVCGKPGLLQGNVEQHHAFERGLKELQAYAKGTSPENYSGQRVQELCRSFGDALREHLADEVSTLEGLRAHVGEDANADAPKKLRAAYDRCEAEAGKNDKFVIPPMVLGLCDKSFQGGNSWPVMPWGSEYFVHYIFARRHAGAWRFLPSDTWGRRRELAFLGK